MMRWVGAVAFLGLALVSVGVALVLRGRRSLVVPNDDI